MRIYDVLYARNTGRIRPRAKITDNLLGLALAGGGYEEKTIDFTPVISISDAVGGNALDYQCKITAKQTGTGDPSPTNIRSIVGWTGANIGHANGAITIENGEIVISYNQSGTGDPSPSNIRPISAGLTLQMDDSTTLEIYGATLNPVTGVLTNKAVLSVIDGTSDPRVAAVGGVWFADMNYSDILTGYCGLTACNAYKLHTGVDGTTSAKNNLALYEFCGCTQSTRKTRVFFRDERFDTTEDLQAYIAIHPVYVVQEMAQAQEIQLSQTELARALTALGVEIIPVSWQSEVGVCYGGVDDVTQGKFTDTHAMVDLSLLSWDTRWTGNEKKVIRAELPNTYTQVVLNEKIGLIAEQYLEIKASTLTNISDDSATVGIYTYRTVSSGISNYIFMVLPIDGTPSGKMVYPVAEPTEYNLTPTEITLAEGANTLWADCGDSKMTYLAKK